MKSKVFKLISGGLLMLGLWAFGSALIKRENAKPEKPTPFVITYQYHQGTQPTGIGVRVVDPSRGWREVRSSDLDCSRWEGGTVDGYYYTVTPEALQYRGEDTTFGDEFYCSEAALRSHPDFAGTVTVAGMTTFLLRSQENDGVWFEHYYSPKTGSVPLKTVAHHGQTENGSEAIAVQFRDISEQELELSKRPVRFDDAEKEAAMFRASGNYEFADSIEMGINKMKEKTRVKE